MTAAQQSQRRRQHRKKSDRRVVRIETRDGFGRPRWVTADLLDMSTGGVGVSVVAPLKPGSQIAIRGHLQDAGLPQDSPAQAVVVWCREGADGHFQVGLQLCNEPESPDWSKPLSGARTPDSIEGLDFYEIMQLSPNADQDTITRVYRMLASRYHPDSPTGDNEMFVRLTEAYRALSDPLIRAKYDVQYFETRRMRWKIFDRAALAASPGEEQRKRRGILEALYAKALHSPNRASMNSFDFEDLLGTPREHLENAFWYLKGKGYVKRSDNGRYEITVSGFDAVESNQETRGDGRKLLEAAGEG